MIHDLELYGAGFRENFDRVLVFANILENITNNGSSTESVTLTNPTVMQCILNSITSTTARTTVAQMLAPTPKFWKDTETFFVENANVQDVDKKLEVFVINLIKAIDKSQLSQEQKDCLYDKIFSDPALKSYMHLSNCLHLLLGCTGTFSLLALLFNARASNEKPNLVFGILYVFAFSLIGLQLIVDASMMRYRNGASKDIFSGAFRFNAWTKNLADELIRLGLPCELNDIQLAAATGVPFAEYVETHQGNSVPQEQNRFDFVRCTNLTVPGLTWLSEYRFTIKENLLRSDKTRRDLQYIIEFFVADNTETELPYKNAVELFLVLREKNDYEAEKVLKDFLINVRAKVQQSRCISHKYKGAIVDYIVNYSGSLNEFRASIAGIAKVIHKVKNPPMAEIVQDIEMHSIPVISSASTTTDAEAVIVVSESARSKSKRGYQRLAAGN